MSKIPALGDLVVALLQEHARDGTTPTDARFLFYELVQRSQRRGRRDSLRLRGRRAKVSYVAVRSCART